MRRRGEQPLNQQIEAELRQAQEAPELDTEPTIYELATVDLPDPAESIDYPDAVRARFDRVAAAARPVDGGVPDDAALDQLFKFMFPTGDQHDEGGPSGADVAQFAARLLAATGRLPGEKPSDFVVDGEVRT